MDEKVIISYMNRLGWLLGTPEGQAYAARVQVELDKVMARPAQCCELCPCTGARDQEACSPCCACGREYR